MEDTTLVAIALCVSACGMTLLLCTVLFYELPVTSVANATSAQEGANLQVKGTVTRVLQRGAMTMLTISEPATLDVTVFEPIALEQGACVIVQGKKSVFNGQQQLTATRVALCS